MSTTVLDRPPRKTLEVRPPPQPSPPRPREPVWLLPVALAVSAAIHVAVLIGLRFSVAYSIVPVPVPVSVVRPADPEAILIVPLTGAVEPERPVAQIERPVQSRSVPAPAPVTGSAQTDAASTSAAGGATEATGAGVVPPISERIRSGTVDPRLWAEPERVLPPVPSNAEIARGRIYARLGTWNDSMLIAAEAAANATDWTATDANGDKWGISPGKLHLGSLTLPLPINFGPPPGRRDEYSARVRTWNESEFQYGRSIVRDDFKSQVKAIRARMDAKRDSTRRSGGGR